MSRRRGTDELTFEAQRELEALEAAIRGEPVAPEHAALAELALALREERPQPSADFARALDDRASSGFRSAASEARSGAQARGALGTRPLAGQRPTGRRPRWPLPRRRLAAGLGAGSALAAVVVASVVVFSGGSSERPRPVFGPVRPAVAGPTLTAPAVPRSGAGTSGSADKLGTAERRRSEAAAPANAGRAEAAPPAAARAIERTATLDVGVSRRSIQSTAGRVFTLASAFGGYVRQSSVSSGSSGEDGASFDVRLPSARLSAAIAALSHLGHVRSEADTTNDVTNQLGALRRALGDLRAERASVLKQLSAASSAERVAALKGRLRALEAHIARLQAQLRALNARVDYTSLALSLTPEASGGASSGNLTPGGAAKDAARILDAALAVLVLAAAALLPLALLVIACWSAIALTRRRLREQALDAS